MKDDYVCVEYNPMYEGQILKIYIPNTKLVKKSTAFIHVLKCLWTAWKRGKSR